VIVSLGGPHGGATAAMIVNGDGDLYDHRGGHIPRGVYVAVGVVTKGYPSRAGT